MSTEQYRPLRAVTAHVAVTLVVGLGVLDMSSAGPASATPSVRSSEVAMAGTPVPATAHAPAKVRQVRTAYGAASFATRPGAVHVVRFQGRRGDLVRVAEIRKGAHQWLAPTGVRVTGPTGRRTAVRADGFVKLGRTGTYRFRFKASSSRARLVKARLTTLTSGQTLRLPAKRGVQHLVRVTATAPGRTVTTSVDMESAVVGGVRAAITSPRADGGRRRFLVEPGQALRTTTFVPAGTRAIRDGSVVLLAAAPGKSVVARTAPLRSRTVRVDGSAIIVPRDASGMVLTVAQDSYPTFPSNYVELLGASDVEPVVRLGGQGDQKFFAGVWPTSPGRTSTLLLVRPDGRAAGVDRPVRVATAVLHPAPLLDDPIEVPLDPQGRATVVWDGGSAASSSVPASVEVLSGPSGAWEAVAGSSRAPARGGCAAGSAYLDRTGRSGQVEWAGGRIVLKPRAGQRDGSWTVAVHKDTGAPARPWCP